jgi:subtilase family serine protease
MRQGSRQLGLVIALACAVSVALAPAPAAARAAASVRLGSAPLLPAGTVPLASLAAAAPIRITIALEPRDPRALRAFATAVADPSSAEFRRYLTPAQFANRFAPRAATVAAVVASLRAHGLEPGRLTANGLALPVRSTVGAVERAFSLSLARVALAGGQRAVINTSAPALDRRIAAAVQSVVGLTSIYHPRPLLVRRAAAVHAAAAPARAPRIATGGPQPCAAATAAASGQGAYTADQIASAYGFSGLYRAGDRGAGETIALYELEPNDPSDIAAYQSCYGTHAQVSYVGVDGGAGSGAGSGEAALDIEQLIGLAPQARIVVYQGPNSNLDSPGSGPYDTDAAIISQDLAPVVSSSWGQCEPVEGATDAASENVLFEEAASQGQTLLSAAGDQGAQDCDTPGSVPDLQLAVDDPASQPFVTGVGGTSLNSIGPPPSETVWNNGGNVSGLLGIQPGAGGGGISELWPMPAFQAAAPRGLNVVQGTSSGSSCHASAGYCRQVPDVSADADPLTGYLIYYNGGGSNLAGPSGWQGTGGTSAGAPLWAALIALADAQKACARIPIGFANPVLYRLAGASEATYFNDVTTGNNDYTGTAGGRYAAGPGYDMATGLGTPKATALAGALCRRTLRLATPAAQRSLQAVALKLHLAASDAPGAGLRYHASGLPAGLKLDSATGLISGRPRRLGTSSVTVEALDGTGGVRVAHFSWTIEGRPAVSRIRLAGVKVGAPVLRLTVASGRGEGALQKLTLRLPRGLSFAAALRATRVSGPSGRRAAAVTTLGRGVLTVRLRVALARVTLSLGAGSLSAAAVLIDAVRAHPARGLRLALTTRDAHGLVATLTPSPRPAS